MTLLKRSMCSPDGVVIADDIDSAFVVPSTSRVLLSIELAEHHIMDGSAWMEEHHTTWVPWWLVLLFFWCITPVVTRRIFVSLEQDGTVVDFDFKPDDTKSFHDNIYHAPESIGIKQVWFHI